MQNFELLSPAPVQPRPGLPSWILGLGVALVGGVTGWWLSPWLVRFWALVLPTGDKAAWYMSRSTATVAYILLTAAVVWGLMLSTKLVKAYVSAPLALALHSALSWLGVALGGLHAFVLLLDRYYSYSIGNILIPFTGPYRPAWVGLGTISLYGLTLVSASFLLRQWLGYRTWRRLHYLSFPLFVLVTLHGLFAGTDSAQAGMQGMYIASGLLVLLLTILRVVQATAPGKKMPSTTDKTRATLGQRTSAGPHGHVLASKI